jgi:predicted dehydrogenase
MLLPHLAGRPDVELTSVVTTTSLSAANAQRKFGFTSATTDVDSLLSDDTVDAIFIVTRHHTHADLVCRALAAGKAVFVEKPLALDEAQLAQIEDAIRTSENDRLMVGFNRRFAPMLTELHERFGPTGGAVARYTVNAGPLSADSWYGNEDLEGSRFVGEGGHFIDTVSWWLGAEPVQVYAVASGDPQEMTVVLRYVDASVATICYLTNGNPRVPKEVFEVSVAGRTARLDNFKSTTVWSGRSSTRRKSRGAIDKGQSQALDQFVRAVATGGAMPISWASLRSTTKATLAASRSLALGSPVDL